ncbi:MAG: RAMP superfamily CRISPR-associated protein, partial [Ktedonobacteraceae bacterium]
MNPYDFVPLDMSRPPERHKPIWHAMLTRQNGPKLYSGHITVYMQAETPLFILDTNTKQDPRALKTHMRDADGYYIIPGSSLKGLLRTVVETLCSGCVPIYRVPKEYTRDPLPHDFAACTNNARLCIACRLFGMMGRRGEGRDGIDVFLGKINIGDASAFEESPAFYGSIYTAVLDTPKPRHRAFYLDQEQRFIAGRKFYFHHNDEPLTENRLLEIRNKPGE